MSGEEESQKKDVLSNENLCDLLDNTLKDFTSRPRTTDDELDELMAAQDQAAAQKAAGDFHDMLQQMMQLQEEAMRQTQQSGDTDVETNDMLEAMKQLLYCSGQMVNASSTEDFMTSLEMLKSSDSPMKSFMTMIMQTVASKEVMYPPLKEIYENFPKYFEDHADSLDAASLDRYKKQYDIIGKICVELEKQPDEPIFNEEMTLPSEDEHTSDMNAFETLGKLLVELQSHGYPPKELTGALPNGWVMDETTGMPKVENASVAAADACCLM